jgi:hypothetical protein
MMQLGDFESAIAVAPKVSLKYWQTCIKSYIEYLDQAQPSDTLMDPEGEKINYLLLLN